MTLKQQYQEVLKRLRRHYTRAPETFVRWKTPLELVVGTVLSAQCTDKRVNKVTKTLFKKYRTARAYARADLDTLKKQIYSIGFYNSKAKYLVGIGKRLVEAYEGKVPNTFDDLMTLPGVAQNCALGYVKSVAKANRRCGRHACSTHCSSAWMDTRVQECRQNRTRFERAYRTKGLSRHQRVPHHARPRSVPRQAKLRRVPPQRHLPDRKATPNALTPLLTPLFHVDIPSIHPSPPSPETHPARSAVEFGCRQHCHPFRWIERVRLGRHHTIVCLLE